MRADFDQVAGVMEGLSQSSWLRAVQQAGFRRQQELLEEKLKKERDDRLDDAELITIAAATVVSEQEMRRLPERLDLHQVAVIEALEENRRQLEAAEDRREEMYGEALVLEDGRRVFKTRDGLRVFDEDGVELSPNEVDPDAIEDWRPRWEDYREQRDAYRELHAERQDLLDYQDKLDDAQERIDRGDLSRDDVEALESLLEVEAPIRVRAHLPYREAALDDDSFGAVAELDHNQRIVLADLEMDLGMMPS